MDSFPIPPLIFPGSAGSIIVMNQQHIDINDPIAVIMHIIVWIFALYVSIPIFIEAGKDIWNAISDRVHKLMYFFSDKKR